MASALRRTDRGWVVEPPTVCPNTHRLAPGQVLVGNQPCTCRGGHLGWTCRLCGATSYLPSVRVDCSLLVGAAAVRSLP